MTETQRGRGSVTCKQESFHHICDVLFCFCGTTITPVPVSSISERKQTADTKTNSLSLLFPLVPFLCIHTYIYHCLWPGVYSIYFYTFTCYFYRFFFFFKSNTKGLACKTHITHYVTNKSLFLNTCTGWLSMTVGYYQHQTSPTFIPYVVSIVKRLQFSQQNKLVRFRQRTWFGLI